jgi:hypothetical protein
LAEYKRPTPDMVLATVNIITSQYSHLCIDDVRLCMQNLFTGLYGEIIALDIERFGKALFTYSEEKRQTAATYQPSNQFPNKDSREAVPMPEEVRDALKNMFKRVGIKKPLENPEKLSRVKIDWRESHPGLDEDTYQVLEYFDEQWGKQGCPLKKGTTDHIIEYNDKFYTRGEFTVMAKKLK